MLVVDEHVKPVVGVGVLALILLGAVHRVSKGAFPSVGDEARCGGDEREAAIGCVLALKQLVVRVAVRSVLGLDEFLADLQ